MGSDQLQKFVEQARTHFAFLISDFGFEITSEKRSWLGAALVFDGLHLRITVNYEMASVPWVTLARIERNDGKLSIADKVSLDRICEYRKKPVYRRRPRAGETLTDDELERGLISAATALRTEAIDILMGDVSLLQSLQSQVERDAAKRRLELYGTDEA